MYYRLSDYTVDLAGTFTLFKNLNKIKTFKCLRGEYYEISDIINDEFVAFDNDS